MKNLFYDFKDKSLLEQALTHSSKSQKNYERLEFLGDGILDFVVGEYFYLNCNEGEGKLTVLRSHYVSENYLAKIFNKLKLEKMVKLGKSCQGEISKSLKCDIVEAIIAAIYLDGGLDKAKQFIYTYFELEKFESVIDDNYKSRLQELIQGNFKCKMSYETRATNDGFISTFFMDEDEISSGRGKSKVEAEQSAAKKAIGKLFLINDEK